MATGVGAGIAKPEWEGLLYRDPAFTDGLVRSAGAWVYDLSVAW